MEKYPELKEKVRAVIFCGGYGTRMWPMSRQSFPKQFQPILGKKSFFQQTLQRIKLGFKPEDIFLSTSEDQVKFVRAQAKEIPTRNIIAEPERRDTLGAVAYATAFLDHHYPDSLMAVVWGADHIIRKEKKFIRALKAAARICQQKDVIVKVDTKTDYVSDSFGWVKIGKKIGQIEGFSIYEFLKFVEKPGIEKAKKLHAQKNYVVHVGYNVWRTSNMLRLYQKYAPACYKHIAKIKKAMGTKDEKKVLRKEYHQIEKVSVDFGLFEHLPPGSQLEMPTDIGWHDSGTWHQLYEALAIGQRQNVTQGEIELIDAKGNLVYMPEKKVAAIIGLDNLIVIDTKDALLVCRRDRAGDVKKMIEQLKEKDKSQYV